jgi:hypothetical protein
MTTIVGTQVNHGVLPSLYQIWRLEGPPCLQTLQHQEPDREPNRYGSFLFPGFYFRDFIQADAESNSYPALEAPILRRISVGGTLQEPNPYEFRILEPDPATLAVL